MSHLILIASLFTAQAAAPAADPNPIKTAAMAFADCVKGKVPSVAPEVTPEAGADSVMAACSAEEAKLKAAVEASIASAPADKQAEARQQYAKGMAMGRDGIIQGIRGMREGTKPAAK